MPGLLWRKWLYLGSLPVLIVVAVLNTHFQTDISAFVIAGDDADEILLASEMQSGKLSRRYILSIGSKDDKPVANGFIQELLAAFGRIEGVADIWVPGQDRVDVTAIQKLYTPHSAHLYSLHPHDDSNKILSEQGLQQRAAFLKKALLSPQGAMVKKMALQDPLLLTLNGLQSLADKASGVLKVDERYQNLILETEMAGLDFAQQQRIQQKLKSIFAEFNLTQNDQYQLEMTGVPVFAVHTQRIIENDITRVSIISSIALTLLFLWIFRSFSALFLVTSLLLAVVTVSVLVTNAVFGYVHGMTMAIGTTLIGICIDYPIHALVHAQSVPTDQRVPVVAKIWPSMVMGGVTTLVGYMALGLSGYPGFQQIAVYAGTGILVSLLITRYILPGMISSGKSRKSTMQGVNSWVNLCARFRIFFVIALLLLSGVAVYGVQSIHWINDLQELTPELNTLKENDQRIRSRMVSIEPGRFILVTGKTTEAALQKAEQVYLVLEQLKAENKLDDYFGLYPWILSEQLQLQNQQLFNERLTEQVQVDWKQALATQGLSVAKLGNLDYAESEPLDLQEVLDSPVRRLLDSQIIIGTEQTLIMIWIAKHQPEALQTAFADLDGAQYFSQRDLLNRMATDYRDRAQTMLLVGISVIVLLLLLRYKSILITLQTLLPAVVAALFILGGWSITGQAVSFLHLVGFLLAVAICVDYGIFYRENRSGNIQLTYQAMAASMLTSALAFGCLYFADTSILKTLASVVALGVILGFLLCPIIINHERVVKT